MLSNRPYQHFGRLHFWGRAQVQRWLYLWGVLLAHCLLDYCVTYHQRNAHMGSLEYAQLREER